MSNSMALAEINLTIESAGGDSEVLRSLVQRPNESDQEFFERAKIVLWEAFHRAGMKVDNP